MDFRSINNEINYNKQVFISRALGKSIGKGQSREKGTEVVKAVCLWFTRQFYGSNVVSVFSMIDSVSD